MEIENHLASRLSKIKPPAVAQMQKKAHQLEAQGIQLTYLMRGEPDFNTPVHICEAAYEALLAGHTQYSPPQGTLELRRAVAERMIRDFGLSFEPETEIIITTGATMGIYLAIHALIDPGDEVIVPDPIYDPYSTIIQMAGGVPVRVPSNYLSGHFSIPIDVVEAKLTKRTKAILINNPWNPTGSVMTRSELLELADLCETNNLIIISDEIYENIIFGSHSHINLASISPYARKRTILVNSFSKTYAMTGWRLGYNLAPPEMTKAMLQISQQLNRSASTFIQYAGTAAIQGSQEEVISMVDTYTSRRELITQMVSKIDRITFHPPEGTFFALFDIRPYGLDSQNMADFLLEQAKVVVVPGSVYGSEGEGFIRLSFAYSENTLRRGLENIIGALDEL